MLMFVGEDLEVLSIASRRQESAWQAPAVAQVVTREELEERGIRTLSQALEMIPGFYMARKEWGTQPYLRGIPDSVLFLYDAVPLGSDISKSLHPLDHELSLASVKRIEIIRGPGSLLWGPDAFAGIVNVVPMTGKDLDGVEIGILYGSPGDQEAFYVNMGHDTGLWEDGDIPVASEDRFGEEKPGRSHYLEASGRFSFRDWFTVSGLLSDYKRPYAMTEEDLTWLESRSVPFGFIKLEAKKDLDRSSALRFTGSYSWLNPEYEIIDLTLKQKERTSYGEVIYDRSFLAGRGLFTAGLSYRERHIEDAPIWDGYLPEYLEPENESFVPIITEVDYDARLRSLFGQYSHKIGDVDLWLGVRNDKHDEYKDHVSYNAGAVWSASSRWVFKVLYGNAYRTPFASQLLEEEEAELEKIKTLNVQIAWDISKHAGLSLCGFASRIENHIMEDPYAGLSQPNNQDIKGVEIEGYLSPAKGFNFSANLTLIDNSGPDEIYHSKTYFDGTVWHYEDLSYPYDSGPPTLFNLTGTWRPSEKVTTFARLSYFSSRQLIYPDPSEKSGSTEHPSSPGVWLLDLSATIRDLVLPDFEEFSVRNLTDKEYDTPGTYSTIEGEPFSATVMLRKRW
jgi:outer membrane receptor protein involved in Fe transport